MIRTRILAFAVAAGMALTASAWAQQAYTTRTANVRAGPAKDFPLVATLAPGTPVNVDGCLEDYLWCDVDFGGGRGWVSSRSLQSYYENRVVPLYGYGANIGLPIVTFSLLNYWDSYYRSRPFYRDRPRFEQRWGSFDRPRGDYRPPRQDYRPPRQDFRPPQVERPRPPQFEQPRPRPPEYGQPRPGIPPQGQRPERPQVQVQPRQELGRSPAGTLIQVPPPGQRAQGPQPRADRIERTPPSREPGGN